MRTRTLMIVAAAAGLLLSSCAADDDPELGVDPPPSEDGDDDADPDDASDVDAVLGDETMQAIEAAVADGAERDDIEVREAASVTWPDGSLGCPEDDEMYTQALVEGYRIVLDVAGDEVVFHGAEGEPPFRCDDPQPPVDG